MQQLREYSLNVINGIIEWRYKTLNTCWLITKLNQAISVSFSLSIIGCMNCGECKPLGSSWLDPESCITYQCEYDPLLKDLFIVEKQLGKINMNTNTCDKFILVIYICNFVMHIYNFVIHIFNVVINIFSLKINICELVRHKYKMVIHVSYLVKHIEKLVGHTMIHTACKYINK